MSDHVWASNGNWMPMSCNVCRRPKYDMSNIRVRYEGAPCDGNDIAQTRDDLAAAEARLRNAEITARYCREAVANLRSRLSGIGA